mgnify:CR=1 FL=1|tara:strand:+ start:9023 stop:9373 length:351 start_codon:yes stop_codon:yes gene_type:complete
MGKQPTDKLTAEFKKNLKAILAERKGLTNAKKLSLAAGLGETAVRDILQNRSASPKLETVYKLSAALNVPPFRLMPSMIDQSYAQLAEKDEEIRILKQVADLDYADLSALKRMAKT